MSCLSGSYSPNGWLSASAGVSCLAEVGLAVECWGRPAPLRADSGLLDLYRSYGLELTTHLKGSYLLAIHDENSRKLTIFQDRMTSPVTLYYTTTGGTTYYSTSLKQLLCSSGISRKMNDEAIEEFLVNGYLYGEHTLLRDVFKLKAGYALVVDKEGVKQVPVEYPHEELSPGEALSRWEKVLSTAVRECSTGQEEICLPISSGYDSSYILNTLHGEDKVVHAFSIGGQFGKNELPQVQENMKQYPKVQLHTALTSSQTLQHFPDIVWRLEGAVYEVGVFLQYELAKLVKSAGKSCLVCGECADQVMNLHFKETERQKPSAPGTYYPFDEYPYIFGSHLILKKNGILFNSFGIETRYPYCDERVISVANALADVNGKDKRCHVANCKALLPQTVLANISKIGGATEFHSLFQKDSERRDLLQKIKASSFYQKHKKVIEAHNYVESVRPRGFTKVKTTLRNVLFSMLRVGQESQRKNRYFLEEMELRDALCVLYLILFEKLFVQGNVDCTENINMGPLNAFLS